MIIETGTIVFFSLAMLIWRLPNRAILWLFGHPACLEIPFALLAYILHYGTFSGMMAAATAGCLCFCFVQLGRKAVGYTVKGVHTPGWFVLKVN